MKQITITVFESAREYFDYCQPVKTTEYTSPMIPIPDGMYVVFPGDSLPYFPGNGSEGFRFADDVTQEKLTKAAFAYAGSLLHLT